MGPLADLLVDACFLPQWNSEDRSPPTEEKHVREKLTRAPAQLASKRRAIQSALQERQGPLAKGASKPHGSTFRKYSEERPPKGRGPSRERR